MAHRTFKYGLWLGLVGFALASGCVVKSGDGGDDGASGEGGESTGGSSTGGKGGSPTGGKGGSATGGSNTGGSVTGGSNTGGSATGGASGSMNTTPECDPPPPDELDNTPYPDCEPRDAADDCEVCIQDNCCEESRICYGYDPGNVCGWGGPSTGMYAGQSELDCYISCAQDYVTENGVYDETAIDECAAECATDECNLIGNATQDIVGCMDANCESDCYGT